MDLPKLSRIVYLADDTSLYLIAGGQGMRLTPEEASPWLKQGVFVVTREDLGPQGYGIELLDGVGSLSRIKHLPGRHDQKSHGLWTVQKLGTINIVGVRAKLAVTMKFSAPEDAMKFKQGHPDAAKLNVVHGPDGKYYVAYKPGQEVEVVSTHPDVDSALSAKNSAPNAANLRVVRQGEQAEVRFGVSQEELNVLRRKVKAAGISHPQEPRTLEEKLRQQKALLQHLNGGVPVRSIPDINVSLEARQQAKERIVKNLTQATGLTEEEISNAIKSWASSSNDTHLPSLMMQADAGEMFGTPPSMWQRKQLQTALQDRERVLSKAKGIPPGDPFSFPFQSEGEASAKTRSTESVEKSRRFLKAMYDETQKRLKAAGITHIEVYRGVGEGTELPYAKVGARVRRRANALESWSASLAVADTFGPVVLRTIVPVERVLSTCRTGFGCLPEAEVVVIGGLDDVVEVVTVPKK